MAGRFLLVFSVSFCLLNVSDAEVVTPPSINHNVHVIQNVSPGQCPNSWRGNIDPETITNVSESGTNYGTAIGVQSCTGCAFDNSSGDCVCQTCYGYYN